MSRTTREIRCDKNCWYHGKVCRYPDTSAAKVVQATYRFVRFVMIFFIVRKGIRLRAGDLVQHDSRHPPGFGDTPEYSKTPDLQALGLIQPRVGVNLFGIPMAVEL